MILPINLSPSTVGSAQFNMHTIQDYFELWPLLTSFINIYFTS